MQRRETEVNKQLLVELRKCGPPGRSEACWGSFKPAPGWGSGGGSVPGTQLRINTKSKARRAQLLCGRPYFFTIVQPPLCL